MESICDLYSSKGLNLSHQGLHNSFNIIHVIFLILHFLLYVSKTQPIFERFNLSTLIWKNRQHLAKTGVAWNILVNYI